MHLLVLTSTFPRWERDTEPGFVFDLCRHLTSGHDITVLAPHAPGAKREEVLGGVKVVRFRYGPASWEKLTYDGGIMANLRRNPLLYFMLPLFFLAQLGSLMNLVRRIQPAAVHGHWIVPQGLVLAAARVFSRETFRAICTVHGSDVSALRGSVWARLRRWAAMRCDRLVAVSEALKTQLVSEGCPAERIDVVPMGTDLRDLFVPDGSARNGTEILFVGRLVPGKGADVLIRAFPGILARQPEATLTVVGGGPERENLDELARRLGIESHIVFAGPVPHTELAKCYRRAALLVLPSREEGFGLVLIEALGCGCPVVASDLPAIRGILGEGKTGRLFRAGDAEDLTRAVCEMLANQEGGGDMARRGRNDAIARYDWHVIAQRYAVLLAADGR
jgi:glycosyltransferase involved in cell wall biosynthesis